MNVILLGPPGCGKGTQSAFIVKEYSIAHISTGDILRAEVKRLSNLGKEAKSYMDKGSLVPDDLIVKIIEARIKEDDCKKGFLLDGFPRTTNQAMALEGMLEKSQSKIDCVLHIKVGEYELMKRLLGRAEKEGRADDNETTIKNRLSVYNSQTKPLIDYYRKKSLLFDIDGLGSVSDITARIEKVLSK